MRSVSPSRRVAGLLAVSTIGLSGALLAVPATAQALPSDLSFETNHGMGGIESVTVGVGTCAVEWTLIGGRGGFGANDELPEWPLQRTVTTTVAQGDVFTLATGGTGADAGAGAAGGVNAQGAGAYDGADGDPATGGGGGAATVVLKNGVPFVSVPGSVGGGAGAGAGGTAPADTASIVPGSDSAVPFTSPLPSRIKGQGVACENPGATKAPAAPGSVQGAGGEPGEVVVYFQPAPTPADTAPATGWEYSLDGGSWIGTPTTPGGFSSGQRKFSVSGLTHARSYGIRVRATSDLGAGAASAPVDVWAGFVRVGAPTDVVVEEGPSSLTVSWSPPTVTGTFPVAGYRVNVHSVALKDALIDACRTDAATRSCVVGVPAGNMYEVFVSAIDTRGATGASGQGTSDVVPAPEVPATVPAKDDDLRGAADRPIDAVTAGQQVVLRGSGFAPNSTVQIVAYSTPTPITTVVTDENGAFEVTVTVPAGLEPGEHSLVATGVDANGNERNLRVDVTVSAAGTPTITRAAELPYSGAAVVGPAIGGLAALGLGAGLLVLSRRRPPRTAASVDGS